MKKIFLIFALVAVAVSCDKLNEKQINEKPTNGGEKVTLSATIEASSRVAINSTDDVTFNHFWEDGDQIRVFDGSGHDEAFSLDGYDPLSPSNIANFSGSFAYAVSGAVYPAANADAAFNGTNFTVTFPAAQTYTANTYDPAANVYVATCSGSTLSFKSLSAYVRIALWSETASTAVDHIVLTSLDGGKIAGKASVDTEGNITMDGSAVSTITLNCATPVAISNDSAAPTYFYVAVPAVAATGLKIDVYKADGSHLWRNVSVNPANKTNTVLKMGALEYSPVGAVAATLEQGSKVNGILKHLAGDDTTGLVAYNVKNTSITKIVLETGKNMTGVKSGVAGQDYQVVSAEGSAQEIVATVKGGIARIQTAADTIATGSCSYLFMNFRGVTSYEGLDSHFAVGNSIYMNYMFRDNVVLPTLDLSKITVNNAATAKYMAQMFYNCPALTSLQLWSTGTFTRDCRQMFYGCSSLATLTNSTKIYSSSSLTSTERMFMNCSSLTSISLSKVNFKIAKVTKMGNMFSGCSKLSSLDVSGFNTENVTSMDSLFHNCDALVSLDLSTFDTRKVTTMKYLCNSCDKLTSLDLSGANCSTEAMSSPAALQNLICNNKKMTTLKLGDNFTLGTGRFASGISYLMLPNPESVTATLTVYSNATIATDLLQQVKYTGDADNARAAAAVVAGKLNFKSLDGSTTWLYYSDAELTTEISAAEVTSASYVGQGPVATEAQASTSSPVASYGAARTGGVSF